MWKVGDRVQKATGYKWPGVVVSLGRRKSTSLVCRLLAAAYGRDVAAISFFADAHAACIATADQAALIREALDIRKRQTISASTLQRLKAFVFARNTHGEASSSSGTAGDVL